MSDETVTLEEDEFIEGVDEAPRRTKKSKRQILYERHKQQQQTADEPDEQLAFQDNVADSGNTQDARPKKRQAYKRASKKKASKGESKNGLRKGFVPMTPELMAMQVPASVKVLVAHLWFRQSMGQKETVSIGRRKLMQELGFTSNSVFTNARDRAEREGLLRIIDKGGRNRRAIYDASPINGLMYAGNCN